MSKRYDELVLHQNRVAKRAKLDEYLKKEGYLYYRDKVWRFASEKNKWQYVEILMNSYEKDEKTIALFSPKTNIKQQNSLPSHSSHYVKNMQTLQSGKNAV